MTDYIERGALLKELRKEYVECEKEGEQYGGEAALLADGISCAIGTLKCFPAADVAPIVRCRDCKRFYKGKYKNRTTYFCTRLSSREGIDLRVKPNDFCSFGKRRNEIGKRRNENGTTE